LNGSHGLPTKQHYLLFSGVGVLVLFTVACSTVAEAIQAFAPTGIPSAKSTESAPIEITNISSATLTVGQRVIVTGKLHVWMALPDPGVTLPADKLRQYFLQDGRGNDVMLILVSGLKIPENLWGKLVAVTGNVKNISAGYMGKHLVIEINAIHRSVQSNHDDATPDRRFD